MGDILGRIEHHGIKLAALAAHGDHAMGRARIVIDGIAGAQDLAVGAHLHLQMAADDQIKLLTLVGGQGDLLALGRFIVLRHGIQRIGDAVLERGSHVVIGHAVGFFDALAVARPGQGVGGQRRAAALDQVGYIDTEGQRAAVQESKVEVMLTRLAGKVFGSGDSCLLRHLCRAEAFHET